MDRSLDDLMDINDIAREYRAGIAAAEAKGYKAGLEKAAEMADYQAVAYQAAGMPRLNGALGLFANSLRAIAKKEG